MGNKSLFSCRYRQKCVSLQLELVLKLADRLKDGVYISYSVCSSIIAAFVNGVT